MWIERFESFEELRGPCARFGRAYNERWLIERHGYRAPIEAPCAVRPPCHHRVVHQDVRRTGAGVGFDACQRKARYWQSAWGPSSTWQSSVKMPT